MYRKLFRFVRPQLWRMIVTVVSNFIAAGLDVFSLSLLIPLLQVLFGPTGTGFATGTGRLDRLLHATVGMLIDPTDKLGSLNGVMFLIVGAVVVKNVFVWIGGQAGATVQEGVTRELRNELYAHLARLPIGWFSRTKTGQVLARVLTDTAQTKLLMTQLVATSLQSAALVVFYLIGMFLISVKLSLLALVVAPLVIGSLQPLIRKLRKGYGRMANDYGEITSIVQETVSGVRLVKSFGAEVHEEGRFQTASDRYARGMVRVTRVALLSQPLTETAGALLAMLVLWVGARDVLLDGTMTGEQLIAFLIFVTRLLQPMKAISQVPATAQQSLAAAARLFEVLDTPTETALDRGTIAPARFERDVTFDHVSFAYDEQPVLRDVSFSVRKGEVVALVGPSGAGKSTLVDLIPRFYEPQGGAIRIDGVETRAIRLDALRALTGIVSQDTVIFNDSVRRNIAYGASTYSDAQVEAAARAANAHAFISALPDGYDTILGERGTLLSGGQRQRIAIARALLVDPPILILDEATSALDTESERLVQEAIDRLLAGRTVFVIAHRLSTVEHASQILVLDGGHVVERGTHAELLARRGAYHRLYSLQFRDKNSAA